MKRIALFIGILLLIALPGYALETSQGQTPSGAASGDLSGSYPNPTVAKIDGIPVSVPPSGNLAGIILSDTTIVVAPSGGDFTTVQAALASLANVVIGNNAQVTIQVNDGTYTNTTPLLIYGAFFENVIIRGQHAYTKSLTGETSYTGSPGNYAVILNFPDLNNFPVAINDYIVIPEQSGGTNTFYSGAWIVTNVDTNNSRVTVTSTCQSAVVPGLNISATVTLLKTILVFNNCTGVDAWMGSTTNLDNLVIAGGTGASTHYGISLQDRGRVYAPNLLAVVGGWQAGFFVNYNSEANTSGTFVSSGNNWGYQAISDGVVDATLLIASGNTSTGVISDHGHVGGQYMVASGNGGDGVYTVENGVAWSIALTSAGNSGWGLRSLDTSVISYSSYAGGSNGLGDSVSTPVINSVSVLNNIVNEAKGRMISGVYSIITPANVKGFWVFDQSGNATTITDRAAIGGASAHTATLRSGSLGAIAASTCSPGIGGLAPNLLLDATHQWDTPSSADFSFGSAGTDSPFSVVTLLFRSATDIASIVAKSNTTSNNWEWMFYTQSAVPYFWLVAPDESSWIGRSGSALYAPSAWETLAATYDGSKACAGVKIYYNGAQVDINDSKSGTYPGMTAGTSAVGSYYTHSGPARVPGRYQAGVQLIVSGALTATQILQLDALLRSYAGVAL